MTQSTVSPRTGIDRWESEGGSTDQAALSELGIVRHLVETYSVGDYRYTNLTDALAAANRLRKSAEGNAS